MKSPEQVSHNLLDNNQALLADDVVFLSASSGAGKSHQLLHSETIRFSHHIYLPLSPMHNGLLFWQDLLALLEEKFSLRLEALNAASIPYSLTGIAKKLKAYARKYTSNEQKLFLVFDNCQYLKEPKLIDELIYFIQLLDANIKCLFSGRDSHLYHQLLDQGDKTIRLISEQNLLLEENEFIPLAAGLLNNERVSENTQILLSDLYAITIGHVGLTRLCIKSRYLEHLYEQSFNLKAASLKALSTELLASQLAQTEEVHAYCQNLIKPLLEPIDSAQDKNKHESIISLPLLTRGLMAQLINSQSLVTRFEDYQLNCLLFSHDGVNFYPIPLFAVWLKQNIKSVDESTFITAIQYYREHQYWHEAIQSALVIKDSQLATELIIDAAQYFSRRGEYQQARQLIDQLPSLNRPLLLKLFENLLDFQQYGHQLAQQRLQDILQQQNEDNMDLQCQQLIALLNHHYYFLLSPIGLANCTNSDKSISQHSELFLPDNQFCAWAWHSLAMEQVLSGQYQVGFASLNKAIYWSRQQGDAPCALASLAWLVVPCLHLGKLSFAIEACAELETWLEQAALKSIAMVGILHRVRCIIHREQGELALAQQSLHWMKNYYDKLDPLNLAYCYWAEFLMTLAQQDFKKSQQLLSQLERHSSIHFTTWQLALPKPELLSALLDSLAGDELSMLSWASEFQIKQLSSDLTWLDRRDSAIQAEILAYFRVKITLGSDMTAECQHLLERTEQDNDKYIHQQGIILSLLNAQRQENVEWVNRFRHKLLVKAGNLEYNQLYKEYLDELLPLLIDYSPLPSELKGYDIILPRINQAEEAKGLAEPLNLLSKESLDSGIKQSETANICLEQPVLSQLTERESQVAQLVQQGLSNNEIAQQLNIGLATVKGHVTSIFNKLGIKRRAQLVHKLVANK
jgi:DNA-binding CsgD family transcriptional regulator